MSDPIPVRISELPSTNTINDTDDFPLVQAGNTVRAALANVPTVTTPAGSDISVIVRANTVQKIAESNAFVRKFVGELSFIPGNVANPSAAFPAFCLTNFEGSTAINATNWPDFVPWLRSQQVIYLEGQAGEVTQFSGTVAGSVITLDDNAANNDVIAALNDDLIATGNSFASWRTVDIDGTTFDISAINVSTREITVTGSPTVGAQNAIFYPHRISASTTTARLHSWRGRSPVGSGVTDSIIGLMRQDRFQGHRIGLLGPTASGAAVALGAGSSRGIRGEGGTTGTAYVTQTGLAQSYTSLEDDTTNGTPRTGATTHGPDIGTHIYQFGGSYSP